MSGFGIVLCGILLASELLTGCASSSSDPVFSDSPHSMTTAGAATGSSGGDAALFRVGETVVVTFSGGGASGNGAGAATSAFTAGATGLCPETTLTGGGRWVKARTIKTLAASSSKTMAIPSGQCQLDWVSAGRTGVSGGTLAVASR